jgi:murein L,D-transpeptidase YcbB/YkuD
MLSRISLLLLASCIAVPATFVGASAESIVSPRKKFNFSSRSFGSDDGFWSQRQRRQQRVRRNNRSFDFFNRNRGFFTTSDDERDFERQVNERKRSRKRVRVTVDDGPDAASTGEKYHAYKADALTRVIKADLKQPRPQGPVFAAAAGATVDVSDQLDVIELTDPVAQATFETLKAGVDGVKLYTDQLDALASLYAKRAYAPLWIEDGKPSAKAKAVVKVLLNASQEGLDPDHYALPVLATAGGLSGLGSDPESLARFELELTARAMLYAHHASGGLVTPNKISGYHDLKPPHVGAKDAAMSLASHPEPASWLMGLHPSLPAYKAMKAELIKLGASERDIEQIVVPEGALLKLGVTDARVPILRKRLKQLNFIKNKDELAASSQVESDAPLFGSQAAVLAAETDSETMTEADVAALKAFQRSAGLSADGMAGRRTIAALNGKTEVNRAEQLALNMERLRWLPRNLGSRYVFVNQPAFEMKIMNGNGVEWKTRVVVGKQTNQTYFFSDEMERVEFNPYWGIPQSIIRSKYLPKLRANPGYFEQRGYEVVSASGRKISGHNVDWWNYKGVGVRQKPGPRNALGEVKFMFPNRHAIYLHDTPQKSLFKRDSRAFSHGCVRVQNPRDLATHILGWSEQKVAATIASGEHTPVKMSKKLPVHLTYFTAWTDENGNLSYFPDVYKRDGYLAKALAAEKKVLGEAL